VSDPWLGEEELRGLDPKTALVIGVVAASFFILGFFDLADAITAEAMAKEERVQTGLEATEVMRLAHPLGCDSAWIAQKGAGELKWYVKCLPEMDFKVKTVSR
jgi:hypothetical protein